MKKYLNRIYTILLIILCVVLCVLQIQAGTLLSTDTVIRFVIIFIAYGLGMAYKKKSWFAQQRRRFQREPIPYICDFSRCRLNVRLSARIHPLLEVTNRDVLSSEFLSSVGAELWIHLQPKNSSPWESVSPACGKLLLSPTISLVYNLLIYVYISRIYNENSWESLRERI